MPTAIGRARALLPLLLVASASACGGYDCVDHTCAELTGDSSLSSKVSICSKPQGDCGEGCKGWRVLDENGNKVSDCLDSVPGNCEPFMTQDAVSYCTTGGPHQCGKGGSPCTVSGDCCAGLFCSLNTCG